MTKTKGILLCAWGKVGYGYSAFNFAASIKKFSPSMPITLVADAIALSHLSEGHRALFDKIELLGEAVTDPGLFKVSIYERLPYDYTLYLDVDALCINPVEPLLDSLISDYEKDGRFYRTHVHGWYDSTSPDDMPLMYWAGRKLIWEKYGFSDHKFPATQSSIQFVAKCDEAEKFYKDLVHLMKWNPIPLDELKHKWGGTQPDELYLNIQIAKDRLSPEIEASMWFCDDAKYRPHELQKMGYTFLSYFGVKARMKAFFLEYYDKSLIIWLRQMGFSNHHWKTHHIFQEKHAGTKVNRILRNVNRPTRPVRQVGVGYEFLSPLVKANGWGLKAFENGRMFPAATVPTEPVEGKVNLYLTNLYETISEARKAELMECHRINCENSIINKIYNFGNLPYDHPKVVNIELDQRMTYQQMIDFANSTDGDYHVLTNSDLYYDQTLNWLGKIDFDGVMLALCRWDFDHSKCKIEAYSWSQGTWIFKGKINLTGMDYTIGLPGCENALAYDAVKQGYRVLNPSVDIRAYHLHKSNFRTYTQADRIHGNGYVEVLITPVSNLLKKTVLIKQPGAVGDIICVLPIANYYAKQGYLVEWLAPEKFHPMLSRADYVKPVTVAASHYEKVIDLSFGIDQKSEVHRIWQKRKPTLDSFVTLKYELAEVPISEARNLKYTRDEKKEQALFDLLGCGKNGSYSLVHLSSNYGTRADIDTIHPVVEFAPVDGFEIWDWRKVIEGAAEIHAIDSSLCNFVDALPVVLGKLYYYKTDKVPNKWDETILTKKWNRINQLEYVA